MQIVGESAMLFTRHPKLMNDNDLCNWLTSLITRKAPESEYLDYKESISNKTQKEKIELCKDITSFANESGGALLYGIPQEDQNGVPVPKDISECGIELANDFIINIENILLDVVAPQLPELFIKVISLDGSSSKSVLLIYHPGSWNKHIWLRVISRDVITAEEIIVQY
jgi:predicted HTH transcriptional regulator